MLLFSERKKLENQYYKWLEENPNVKPCPFTVISFLYMNNNLVKTEEYKQIKVLEKALEMACIDLLCQKYPNRDFTNYKPKITIKRYQNMAKTILEEKNYGCKKKTNFR